MVDFRLKLVPGVRLTKFTFLLESALARNGRSVMRVGNETAWSLKTLSRLMFCDAIARLEQI